MALLEPVLGEPAAVATVGDERALVVADFHAGVEAVLRREGLELESHAASRRDHVLALLDRTDPDRVVFLGDLAHWIGEPGGSELDEITRLLDAVTDRVPAILVKGNHDGGIEDAVPVDVTAPTGIRIGDVGFAHGHTWPGHEVLSADVLCVGHEHPAVRLEDRVGGRRIERVWLRGALEPTAFADRLASADIDGELVVFPAFNDLVGDTWVNVPGQGFLAPFLPAALPDGDAYLLDGTRLGAYRSL